MMLVHQTRAFRDWGAGFALRLQPGQDEGGLSFSVEPTWGEAAGGAQSLWQAQAGFGPQAALKVAAPQNHFFWWSETVRVSVTFSENVDVTGEPRVELGIGTCTDCFAEYVSGTGTSTLVFTLLHRSRQKSAARAAVWHPLPEPDEMR